MDITQLLSRAETGDREASAALYDLVYQGLYSIAHSHRSRWRGDETLNATALVNEAYLKLASAADQRWQNRGHYFAVASRAMRQILVDRARERATGKRGNNAQHFAIDDALDAAADGPNPLAADVLTVHGLLDQLEVSHPRQVRVIECRFFAGLSIDETAEALAISATTVRRDWELAKIWLHQALGG